MSLATDIAGNAAIVGLGITETGQVYGRSAADFAAEAVQLAVADAGLTLADVDGLLVSAGLSGGVHIGLAHQLGLTDLGILSLISQAGSTAGGQVQIAAMAIAAGLATTVVCVHADAPLKPAVKAGDAYRRAAGSAATGFAGLGVVAGPRNPTAGYALAAQRHMSHYGTTSEQLGAIAVGQREWAGMNPQARFRDAITLADHQASRFVAEPLHLLDCCMVSNGGVAVVVTAADRAAHLAQPPVHLWGWAQTHPGYRMEHGSTWGLHSGAAISGPAAMKMAGITPADVDVCEIYDCYTYTVLITLEDYGFCAKGEGGAFAASGALAPGGSLPTNTGGGQLSSFYLWGMTPLSEAIIQVRGQGGERQVAKHDVVISSGNGGVLDFHSTLVLGAQARQ
ncbi:MAG: thiolase family protein [Ilumatobacteraceae bacterium]